MTGEDWDPYDSNWLGHYSALEWSVRSALVDLPELTLEEAFIKLKTLPEEICLNHYQFRPATSEEIEYFSSLSLEYLEHFTALELQMLAPGSEHLKILSPEMKARLRIDERVAQSHIDLGRKLMTLCRQELQDYDYLPYSMWYDMEFSECVDRIWNSGILTGIAEKKKSKRRIVEDVKLLVNNLEQYPHDSLQLLKCRLERIKKRGKSLRVHQTRLEHLRAIHREACRCSSIGLPIKESSKMKTIMENVNLFRSQNLEELEIEPLIDRKRSKRLPWLLVCQKRSKQLPWLLVCLGVQCDLDPYFTYTREVREFFHSVRHLANFCRNHRESGQM